MQINNRWWMVARWCALVTMALMLFGASALALTEREKKSLEEAQKHLDEGGKFFDAKRYERAIAEFQVALRIWPDHPDALYSIAVCQTKLGKIAEAKAIYEKLITIKFGRADAFTNYGEIWDSENDTKKAEEYYRKAIEADSKFGRAYHNLGILLENSGRNDEALQAYETHLKLEETKPLERREPYAYYSLGVFRLNNAAKSSSSTQAQAEIKAAKELLLKARAIDPDSIYINNALGNVYVLEKNAAMALNHFQMAQKKGGDGYAPVHEGFGDVYRLRGETAKAIESYKKALKLREDYASVYFKLGEMASKDSPKEAISYFQNYLKYGKNPTEKEIAQKLIEQLQQRQ